VIYEEVSHWWSYERPKPAPALRLILIWDNLKGHISYQMVRWLLQHGILPFYTPLSGSWLNMAESMQRIIVRRALAGAATPDGSANHRLVRTNRGRLEPGSHAFCVEREAEATA
jgi:DDE superfamily endonuclease